MCRYRWNPNGNHLCLQVVSWLCEYELRREQPISYRLRADGHTAWWVTIRAVFIFFVLLTKQEFSHSEARPARSRAVTPREAPPRPALPAVPGRGRKGAARGGAVARGGSGHVCGRRAFLVLRPDGRSAGPAAPRWELQRGAGREGRRRRLSAPPGERRTLLAGGTWSPAGSGGIVDLGSRAGERGHGFFIIFPKRVVLVTASSASLPPVTHTVIIYHMLWCDLEQLVLSSLLQCLVY